MEGNIRKNGIVGSIQYNDITATRYLSFAEWHNGEGMDFVIDDTSRFDLNLDDMQALVTALIATGMIDIEECKKEAKKINKVSKRRQKSIEEITERWKETRSIGNEF